MEKTQWIYTKSKGNWKPFFSGFLDLLKVLKIIQVEVGLGMSEMTWDMERAGYLITWVLISSTSINMLCYNVFGNVVK